MNSVSPTITLVLTAALTAPAFAAPPSMAPLEDKLAAIRQSSAAKAPAKVRALFQDVNARLRDSGLAGRALKVHDRAPSFTLPNARGKPVSSEDLLKKGPLVVVFYRGHW